MIRNPDKILEILVSLRLDQEGQKLKSITTGTKEQKEARITTLKSCEE